MQIVDGKKLKEIIVVGERLLVKPLDQAAKTKSGLYLPPGVKEKEPVQSGYIIKAGPGYPIPFGMDENESWKGVEEKVKYLPLQVQEGDLAIYLQNNSYSIEYDEEQYVIVPQSAVLMLVREEELE